MSDLDDALNSSAPMFHPVEINADWEELPPGYSSAGLVIDAISDLGQQIGPNGYAVEQSLDDALPDPVTMTGTNDASGKLVADLVGRQANIADAWGWRTNIQSGTLVDFEATIYPPTDAEYGDYCLATISVTTDDLLTDVSADAGTDYGWKLLGKAVDATLTVWLLARAHYTGAPPLNVTFPATVTISYVSVALWARTAAGSIVPIVPGTPVSAAETVSQTTHTLPSQTLRNRGYTFGVFATTGAFTWTPGGDGVEIAENGGGPKLQITRSPFRTQPGDYVMSSVTSATTSLVAMMGLPLNLGDREVMDATEYFSPFNRDSPLYDFERDTAPIQLSQPVVTASGVISTRLFTGQMASLPLKSGRLAELQALSRTRLDLDKSLVLPTVHGLREGGSLDWLVTYLMAHGGQYPGVAPSPQTRSWVPFYGSLHPFMAGNFSYPRAYEYIGGVETLLRPPTEVEGPFVKGMYAQQLNARSVGLRVQFDDQPPLEGLPGMAGEYNDFITASNNCGRMTVWIRGDVRDAAATSLGAGSTHLFEYWLENRNTYAGGSISKGGIIIRILGTGQIQLRMGSDGDGYGLLDLTPTFLPSDGNWHFFGVAWDWDSGVIKVNLDSTPWSTSGWATTMSNIPESEADLRQSGGYVYQSLVSRLPISEFQVEAGEDMYAQGFARFWPTPTAPSFNATFRPTNQWIEVIADVNPVQGWTTLSELARASLSAYRTNEEDNFEFLPLSYFGEAAQMTPTVVADTEINAGELSVVSDPSKTRNVVTLEYEEVRVDTLYSRVLSLTSAITIPRGVSYWTFPLDVPAVEILGALTPYGIGGGQGFDFIKLTSGQISTPATIPTNRNFMTVNTKVDGSGSNWDKTTINARIVGTTTSTVTIRFTNSGGGPLALSNSGQDVPFLAVLGYAIRETPAYTTVRDTDSVRKRRERTLTSQMPWIQRRDDAELLAAQLLNVLARPRDEVSLTVMGDPRRQPGEVVTIADAEGTRAEGLWRVLSVTHQGNGPKFVQDLKLVRVLSPGIWDAPSWDNVSWGE